jgi:putative ABC transport system permease protein
MFFAYLKTALSQLIKNKGRSVLTMLGIIIGIGSVIFIMTTGEVAKNFLLGQISQFGTNVIEVAVQGELGGFGEGGDIELTEDDVTAVENSPLLPDVTGVSAGYSVVEDMTANDITETISVFGDRPALFEVNNLDPIYGRFFTESEMDNRARVVVIDEPTAEKFFNEKNAVGERVKIGGASFTVIGITKSLTPDFGFTPAFVYAPITTVKKEFASGDKADTISFLLVEFDTDSNAESFSNRLEYVLRENNGLLDDDGEPYLLFSREQGIAIFDSVLIGIQAFISAVAAISLVVGGIGIMNIMLVTVKERTKEIGLRKAIGAKNNSILTQFLIESVVLTTVGGLIGISLGLGLTAAGVAAANVLQPDWGVAFVFVPNAIFLATGVAVSVGLIFGLYPAVKASRLEPIEALRYE